MSDDPTPPPMVPFPDPTTRTVEQLLREIGALKELLFTRLNATDETIKLFREDITRVPTAVDRQVGTLRELVNETFKTVDQKFASVQLQFSERDLRMREGVENAARAVDAALQAAREMGSQASASQEMAVSKSEVSVLKQLDQIQVLLAAKTEALDGRMAELKDRVTAAENRDVGHGAARSSAIAGQNQLISIISVVASVVFALIAVFMAFNRSPPVVERERAPVERIIERERVVPAPAAPAPVEPS